MIKAQFDDAQPFSEGLARVQVGDLFGYIDGRGDLVIRPRFLIAGRFSQGLAVAALPAGEETTIANPVLPVGRGSAIAIEGQARVLRYGKMGFIDKTGGFVIQPSFSRAKDFSEGLAPVQVESSSGGKFAWGYVNKEGEFAIKPVLSFDDVSPFSEGLAVFRKNWNEGYIDTTGRVVIDPKYIYAQPFKNGVAQVSTRSGGTFKIDKKGRKTSPVCNDTGGVNRRKVF